MFQYLHYSLVKQHLDNAGAVFGKNTTLIFLT